MSLLVPVRHRSAFPWAGFGEIERHLDRVFNGAPLASLEESGTWMPAVDIRERDDAYLLEADLPGLTREDITVSVVEDRVTLKGARKREEHREEKGYRRYERAEGSFERSFRIHGGIDANKVDARFENGVLRVTLPKPEQNKPKQIEVKVN